MIKCPVTLKLQVGGGHSCPRQISPNPDQFVKQRGSLQTYTVIDLLQTTNTTKHTASVTGN